MAAREQELGPRGDEAHLGDAGIEGANAEPALVLPLNADALADGNRGHMDAAPAPLAGGLEEVVHAAVRPREAADDDRRPASPAQVEPDDVVQYAAGRRGRPLSQAHKRARSPSPDRACVDSQANRVDSQELPDDVLLHAYQEWSSSPDEVVHTSPAEARP